MMKYIILLIAILTIGCLQEPKPVKIDEENWAKRKATIDRRDSLLHGKTYLSVYSEMHSTTQGRKYSLVGMVSIRNISETDTLFVTRADYFNTEGSKVRTYFDFPVYVYPMETIEIIIEYSDTEGGTGSNFLFEWETPTNCPEPFFEAVMSSKQGTQGMAFVTHGVRVK